MPDTANPSLAKKGSIASFRSESTSKANQQPIHPATNLLGLRPNISSIGASLAVAFLSTLYGVLSARMIYMPAATRLRQEAESQRSRHLFLAEGMSMLAGKKAPMYIQDRLNGFLRPDSHNYFRALGEPRRQALPSPRLKVVNS